jgi:hypothetical protein
VALTQEDLVELAAECSEGRGDTLGIPRTHGWQTTWIL